MIVIVIDGARGEGGGQIFRTSLTLSMCLGVPVNIKNIRAGRSKPGLLRQHLTCLQAAQTICNAEVSGATLGSTEVSFIPGEVQSGRYRFSVGSAGSTTLVFQTICLPLAMAGADSELYLEGGTHNGLAPSYDFIEACFIPALRRIGYRMDVSLERYGFYPAGGGAWNVRIHPVGGTGRFEAVERGRLVAQTVVATSARMPGHVTERELRRVAQKWPFSKLDSQQKLVDSVGPGNIFAMHLVSENITEVVEHVGEKGVKAERVADKVLKDMLSYVESAAAVGEHLSDQLLLPMVLGKGGRFSMVTPSQHFLSNVEVIKQFVDIAIELTEMHQGHFVVQIDRALRIDE